MQPAEQTTASPPASPHLMSVKQLSHGLSSLGHEEIRQLNALIKPLRLVRDKPRPTPKSLLVEATAEQTISLSNAGSRSSCASAPAEAGGEAPSPSSTDDVRESPDQATASKQRGATATASKHRSAMTEPKLTTEEMRSPAAMSVSRPPAPTSSPSRSSPASTPSVSRAASSSSSPSPPSQRLSPSPPRQPSPPLLAPTTSNASASPPRKRKRSNALAATSPASSRPTKQRTLTSANLLTKAKRDRRQRATELELRSSESPNLAGDIVLAKWSRSVPQLSKSWESLLSSYPSNWPTEQRLVAADEALFKASLLHPELPLNEFSQGLQSWVAQWIDSAQRPAPVQVPEHLRGKKDLQEFWAMDRNIQAYQNTHVVTAALLRLAKVRLAEKYEQLKQNMRLPVVRRKRGQTAAAKAREFIFETTYLDPAERDAAKRRFDEAQYTSTVLVDLCREHSYGILIAIPPSVSERDFRSTTAEFTGFRAALRILLGDNWSDILRLSGDALVSLSEGQRPKESFFSRLRELREDGGEGRALGRG